MSIYGLIVGLNDLDNRAHEVFSRHIESTDTKRSIIVQGAIIQETLDLAQKSEGESILSFPSGNIAAFLFLSIKNYNGSRTRYPLTIAFTLPVQDQFRLYREALALRKLAKVIRGELLPYLTTYSRFKDISSDIKRVMTTKFSEGRVQEILNPAKSLLGIEDISAEKIVTGLAPLAMLNNLVPKNLDQAVYALIIGLPVAVVGVDQASIHIVMQAFETFTPLRKIKRLLQTGEIPGIIDYGIFDLIGFTAESIAKSRSKLKSFVVVDLNKGSVQRGRKNKYCEKIITDLVDAEAKSDKLLKLLSKRRIDWLLMNASALTLEGNDNNQKVVAADLIKKIDRDTLYLIAKILESKNSVVFKHILKKNSLRARIFKALF